MYPTYKYKPKKRTLSSGSNSAVLPISPPTSNSSVSLDDLDTNMEDDIEEGDDSLGSLEDLDLLDVGAIDDNGMQDIIEEVMHMESSENDENAQVNQNIMKDQIPKVKLSKLNQPTVLSNAKSLTSKSPSPVKIRITCEGQLLPPSETIPQKPRPGPGRPRKNKANILKPTTTIYKKTNISSKPTSAEFQSEVVPDLESLNLPPIKRVKLTEEEIIKILKEDASIPTLKKSHSAIMKVEAIEKELLEADKIFSLEEENPPSVDNPRNFEDLKAKEETFIGDIERTFAVFENRSDDADDKHIEFMKKLDNWGIKEENVQHHMTAFYGDNKSISKTDMEDLDIPEDWNDPELFDDLDTRLVTESVFLNTWLPKFALKIRKDPYRALLRSMNKKDPEFNIIW